MGGSLRIRMIRRAAVLFVLLGLAACKTAPPAQVVLGNSCENLAGEASDPLYLRVYCVTEFDEAAATVARDLAEFAAQKFSWYFTDASSKVYSSFSFRSVRAEYAHSVNLSGKGEMIAIIDDGFYLQHPELADKDITVYGSNLPQQDHGTAVASIAAGTQDDFEMMGVAFNAALHLTSFNSTVAQLAAATDDARLSGAIVQNNSWDIGDSAISNVLNRDVGVTAYEAFATELGTNVSSATAYVTALENFTQDGVVVFANSNDHDATGLSVMAGLPLAFPELEAGWITAQNGLPTFNSSGEIVAAERFSASCFEMARSCLMAEGIVYSAVGTESYGLWVGTSFADPIISGGVAILAEAFPSLSGPEIRDRLLVTADNSFFAFDGVREFNGSITHGYSEDYGHGFMNLEAALLPIGEIGLPAGTLVSDGITPLGDAIIVAGSAQGDAVITALADAQVMMLDSLGGNFKTPATTLVADIGGFDGIDEIALFFDDGQSFTPIAGALKSASLVFGPQSPLFVTGGISTDVTSDLGLTARNSGLIFDPITMAAIRADNAGIGIRAPLSEGFELSAHTFASQSDTPGQTMGFGLALHAGSGADRLTLGLSIMEEQGAALGMQSLSTVETLSGTSRALDVGYSRQLSDGVLLEASGQIGLMNATAAGIWGGQTDTLFTSFGLNLNQTGVLSDGDSFTLSLRQPLAIEQGSTSVLLPQVRSMSGEITSTAVEIDLAPSARQLDLGAEYEIPLAGQSDLTLGAAYSMNAGNTGGAQGFALAARYSVAF